MSRGGASSCRELSSCLFPFVSSLVSIAIAAPVGFAQTHPPFEDSPVHLERFIVTSGLAGKTSSDLAQGTAVLTGEDLRRRTANTLGDTLDATPGVSSTYYGPGASRPIIRGLGGDRIRILQDGIGALDASNISPDHNVAFEPLFARSVEVLRGPTTLLYGSSGVGGIVNVFDNRIPEERFAQPLFGTIEFRGFGAADETTGVAAIGGGTQKVGMQIDALKRHTANLRIPGIARIDADAPAVQPSGIVPNSDIATASGSVGLTWFGTAGYVGVAASDYRTEYGVPVDEPISIAMRQHRLDFAAALTQPFGIFSAARARFGIGDYTHREVADHTVVNTTFRNQAWEGRLELPHVLAATVKGTVGAQAEHTHFAAIGDEVVTPPFRTGRSAAFAVEEWKHGNVAVQFGSRVEHQVVTLGRVSPDLPPVSGFAAYDGEKKTHIGMSSSLGLLYYPAEGWSAGLAVAYTERLPTAPELFSNGPHGGTAAWEVGTSELRAERSTGVEVSLKKRIGDITGSFSAFVNEFRGFIFEQRLSANAIPAEANDDGLTPYQFTAKNARFSGAEAEIAFHLIERKSGGLHLIVSADFVHAEQTVDHEPLPRIPPRRYGVALRFDGTRWRAGIDGRRVERQNRVAPLETPTLGYTLLGADLSYLAGTGQRTCELFVRGGNLNDATARVHTSFLKEFVPLPGRNITTGVRFTF